MAEGAGVEPASSESESEVQAVIPTLNGTGGGIRTHIKHFIRMPP